MTTLFHYPNGKKPRAAEMPRKSNPPTYANRGMNLETLLNDTNEFYRLHGKAVIHKKPTPLQIVKVDYPKRSAAKVTEAYFKQASTTDYNGVYRGKYIDFEAKETNNKTSFPLGNFHDHQINHMRECERHGGICFVIIRFSRYNTQYVLSTEQLLHWWEQRETGRKSIPLAYIEQEAIEVPTRALPAIDYLTAIEAWLD
ncbi:Holliday junction resolvase RecU [Exiguobacterium sp. SH3S1]|uniref:Holliday junction resolvase RecU n=1 Tax=Exiguobacterium sp. SH3S1 TaxID=2510955 RepID=UPI00103CA6B7|nr:Holliday junction resolvase RecU [Exiguobacterium sp. SH3S1]TCI66018.1 Holliday junction resolvase RecU [Exiguobacterium sp. SH3S1]